MTNRLALCAVFVLAGMGVAHAEGLDVIALRQSGMALEGGAFGFIRSVVAAKGDIRTVEGPAKAIARWQILVPTLFPAGSDKGGDTKALPEIWSDRAGFDKMAADAVAAATRMAAAANAGNADAVAEEVKALGMQCGGCHRAYRAK